MTEIFLLTTFFNHFSIIPVNETSWTLVHLIKHTFIHPGYSLKMFFTDKVSMSVTLERGKENKTKQHNEFSHH